MKRWFSLSAALALQLGVLTAVSGCTGLLSGDSGAPLGEDGRPLRPYVNGQGEVVDGVFVREDGVLVNRDGVPIQVDPVTGEPILDAKGNPLVDPNASGPGGQGLGENWEAKAFDEDMPVSPTRRLTKSQYQVSVVQAFGFDMMLPELPGDEATTFEHDPEASPLGDYETYVGAATEVGRQISENLIAACNFEADAAGCTQSQIVPALRILYRHDVSASESSDIAGVIDEAIQRTGDTKNGVTFGVARALLDPRFLYRIEEGSGEARADGGVALTDFEKASRLSFFSSDEPPSSELLDLASTGSLSDAVGLSQQVESALTGDSLRGNVWAFMQKMLGLSDGQAETDPLKRAMNEETRRFVEYILVDEQGEFSDLLGANYSFINAELAAHYGVPAPAQDWEKYEFPVTARRRGILTHASFLSAHGRHERDISWIFRGKTVYENFFCGKLPPPPPGVVDVEPMGSRTEDVQCRGCHVYMDPTGQFFDGFAEDGSLLHSDPAPGDFKAGSDIDLPFADLPEFLTAAAESRAFQHCFVKHWFGEALGRHLTETDEASFDLVLQTLKDTGSLRAMLKEMAMTPSFQSYYPKPSEQLCQ